MLKRKYMLIAGIVLLTGCSREVYLQEVPCVECEQKVCPCYGDSLECCPELKLETKTYTFEIEDIKTEPTNYTPCGKKTRKCRTVCREVEVTKPTTTPQTTESENVIEVKTQKNLEVKPETKK